MKWEILLPNSQSKRRKDKKICKSPVISSTSVPGLQTEPCKQHSVPLQERTAGRRLPNADQSRGYVALNKEQYYCKDLGCLRGEIPLSNNKAGLTYDVKRENINETLKSSKNDSFSSVSYRKEDSQAVDSQRDIYCGQTNTVMGRKQAETFREGDVSGKEDKFNLMQVLVEEPAFQSLCQTNLLTHRQKLDSARCSTPLSARQKLDSARCSTPRPRSIKERYRLSINDMEEIAAKVRQHASLTPISDKATLQVIHEKSPMSKSFHHPARHFVTSTDKSKKLSVAELPNALNSRRKYGENIVSRPATPLPAAIPKRKSLPSLRDFHLETIHQEEMCDAFEILNAKANLLYGARTHITPTIRHRSYSVPTPGLPKLTLPAKSIEEHTERSKGSDLGITLQKDKVCLWISEQSKVF